MKYFILSVIVLQLTLYLTLGIDPICTRPVRSKKPNLTFPNLHIHEHIPYRGPEPTDFVGRLNSTLNLDGVFERHVWRNYEYPPDETLKISLPFGSPYPEDYELVEECYYDNEWKAKPKHPCRSITHGCDYTVPKAPYVSEKRMLMLRKLYKNYVETEKDDRALVYNCYYKHPHDEYRACFGITWGGRHLMAQDWITRRELKRQQLYKGLVKIHVIMEICTRNPNSTSTDCKDLRRAMEQKTTPSSVPSAQ